MADLTGLGSVADFLGKVVDRVWVDPAQRDAAKQKIAELHTSGELARLAADTQVRLGQIEINKIEAASPRFWNSGWRPAVGWVGVISLALVYWPKALLLATVWAVQAYHAIQAGTVLPVYPDLGLMDIIGLLGTLLGVGGLRTAEKMTNTEKNR